jgi:hypothetical protein
MWSVKRVRPLEFLALYRVLLSITMATLSIPTTRVLYMVKAMAALLYGAKAWTLKANHVKHLA